MSIVMETAARRLAEVFFVAAILPACGGNGGDGRDADADADGVEVDVAEIDGDADGHEGEPDLVDAEIDTGEAVIPSEHPRIYLNEENRARLAGALASGSEPAARFRAMVDDQLAGGDHYAFSAWFAALLGQLTGDGAYGEYAVAMVDDFVTSEESAVAAGDVPTVAFDSYLYVGDHIGDLALTYDWCFDLLTDAQKERWLAYANQAVWNVWHPEEAAWGGEPHPWSGWSINNPSNNYYYSFLRATMLLGLAAHGEHPDADGWITMFRETKLRDQLFPNFNADLEGGGSREGTGYGVSMRRLFELYDIWQASTGENVSVQTPHTLACLPNFLHLTVPTLDRIAPIGDHARDSTAALFDYHRGYVQILTWLFREDALAPYGQWFLGHSALPEMDQGFMAVYDFLYDMPDLSESPLSGLYPAYHAPGTGQVFIRSSWDADAAWINFIAGPYTESHAHHDQGSIMVYKNEWLAYDQNIHSHSGIRQEEELHNLVRVEQAGETIRMVTGAPQANLTALADDPLYSYAAADVTPIYDGDPSISRSEREIVFLKPDVLVVFDRVDAAAGSRRVWQLNSPVEPSLGGDVATIPGSASTLSVQCVLPEGAAASVLDWTADSDMNGGYRLDIADETADGESRFLCVLSLDGGAETVSATHEAGQLGVMVELAAGGSALVRFDDDASGGMLVIYDGTGVELVNQALSAGVADLPLFASP
jgi:hypothetical protein